MPKSPLLRAANPSANGDHAEREPRGQRRKRETRARLLEAAFRLMAEKGMEGVAINEITEAADVGFGSFYNHFESKEAIYGALVGRVFEELRGFRRDIADPAELISVYVRHTLLRVRRDPVWGQFVLRARFSSQAFEFKGLRRDIENGVKAKRFQLDDVLMMWTSVRGTVAASIALELQFGSSPTELKRLGDSAEELPERTAATVLRILGLDQTEAEAIARRPLPSIGPELASADTMIRRGAVDSR